jgi:hypothetical protein
MKTKGVMSQVLRQKLLERNERLKRKAELQQTSSKLASGEKKPDILSPTEVFRCPNCRRLSVIWDGGEKRMKCIWEEEGCIYLDEGMWKKRVRMSGHACTPKRVRRVGKVERVK